MQVYKIYSSNWIFSGCCIINANRLREMGGRMHEV